MRNVASESKKVYVGLYVSSEPHGMKTFGKVELGEITDCSVVSRGGGGVN